MLALELRLAKESSLFLPLLHAAMTAGAERLPVEPVPEQRLVASMGRDVIHKGRIGTAHRAAGMKVQELGPRLLPLARIATLAAVRAGGVIAALAFKLAL